MDSTFSFELASCAKHPVDLFSAFFGVHRGGYLLSAFQALLLAPEEGRDSFL